MIETYSAMKGGGLGNDDLAPVLTALYRSAATGIVEDSGPALPLEIVMKTVGRAAAKSGGAAE